MEKLRNKNWLENLKNSEIEKFIQDNFNIKYRDFKFEKVLINNKPYIKINLFGKHGFPSEICGNDFMEEEFYFGEFFIKSDSESINTNPYEFYKFQVDNNKLVFAWQNLVLKSNKNTLINSKPYYKNLKLEMNKVITKFFEYIACELTKKYLHNTFHSRKLSDEEGYVIELSEIKDSFNKEKNKLNNYIKKLHDNINKEDKYEK